MRNWLAKERKWVPFFWERGTHIYVQHKVTSVSLLLLSLAHAIILSRSHLYIRLSSAPFLHLHYLRPIFLWRRRKKRTLAKWHFFCKVQAWLQFSILIFLFFYVCERGRQMKSIGFKPDSYMGKGIGISREDPPPLGTEKVPPPRTGFIPPPPGRRRRPNFFS